jgi:hypothetical protein
VTRLVVVLQLDGARLCAELGGPDLVQRAGGRVRGTSTVPPASCPCALTFASTWSAIQAVLFAGHTCTQPICHGAAPGSGSLDLRPTAAYANLIRVSSTYDATLTRVVPGSPEMSLLWLKLAARTLRRDGVPLSPMPIGDLPLSPDELDAVARWIEAGAPESGVVTGTAVLLGACLTP